MFPDFGRVFSDIWDSFSDSPILTFERKSQSQIGKRSKLLSRFCFATEFVHGIKKRSISSREKVNAFCELLPVKDWNKEAAFRYGKLRTELDEEGASLAAMDLQIAASALTEAATLIISNTVYFSKVKHFSIENWLE